MSIWIIKTDPFQVGGTVNDPYMLDTFFVDGPDAEPGDPLPDLTGLRGIYKGVDKPAQLAALMPTGTAPQPWLMADWPAAVATTGSDLEAGTGPLTVFASDGVSSNATGVVTGFEWWAIDNFRQPTEVRRRYDQLYGPGTTRLFDKIINDQAISLLNRIIAEGEDPASLGEWPAISMLWPLFSARYDGLIDFVIELVNRSGASLAPVAAYMGAQLTTSTSHLTAVMQTGAHSQLPPVEQAVE
jgi:hypothetical protein